MSSVLLSHPIQQFKKNPRFYLQYDAFYFFLCTALSVLMLATGFKGIFRGFDWWWLLFYPIVLYVLIHGHIQVHNAVHGNFPRLLNRLIGELMGAMIVVRYASWDIVHIRHHKYSDDGVKDPHPTYPSYWRSFFHSVASVEQQLQQHYYDAWGDTPETQKYERFRMKVSYGTNVVLLLAWYLALGPAAFWFFFVPGNIFAAAFVGHFNWSTHNGIQGREFRPVNLDNGYFYWGNKVFCGIYMHANHHKRPHLFNPHSWDARKFGDPDVPVDAAPNYGRRQIA